MTIAIFFSRDTSVIFPASVSLPDSFLSVPLSSPVSGELDVTFSPYSDLPSVLPGFVLVGFAGSALADPPEPSDAAGCLLSVSGDESFSVD